MGKTRNKLRFACFNSARACGWRGPPAIPLSRKLAVGGLERVGRSEQRGVSPATVARKAPKQRKKDGLANAALFLLQVFPDDPAQSLRDRMGRMDRDNFQSALDSQPPHPFPGVAAKVPRAWMKRL